MLYVNVYVYACRCGVDKQIVMLMRERCEGNTKTKLWHQVTESYCEEYLQRKDLYTTMLAYLRKEKGGILSEFFGIISHNVKYTLF